MSNAPPQVPSPFSGSGGRRSTPAAVLVLGLAVGVFGVVSVVVGTFLPWLSSGGVLRNSYAIVGIAGRLGFAGTGFGATALSWWPFVGPVAVLGIVAGIVRLFRTAAVITLLFGLLTGVIGGGVLAVAGGHAAAGVRLSYEGPVVTVAGAAASMIGSILVLLAVRRRRRGRVPVAHTGRMDRAVEPFAHTLRLSQENAHDAVPLDRPTQSHRWISPTDDIRTTDDAGTLQQER